MGSKRFDTVYDFVRADADAYVRCSGCGHQRRFEGMQLVNAFNGPLPLDDARKRFRCTKCGARNPNVAALPRL